MAVLSNNGRLISSLPATSIISATDEFLIQSNGITKRTSYAALTSSILSAASFNPFINQVRFTNSSNVFSGSFYNPNGRVSNLDTVSIRNGLKITGSTYAQTITANKFSGSITGILYGRATGSFKGGFTGSLSGSVKGRFTGSYTGSLKGNVASTGINTFNKIVTTRITSSAGFVGNLIGDTRGDVYNESSVKVLESGNTTTTSNGGVASAYFYGTSSYANQALTAAYAATGGTIVNGIPIGGTGYQLLAKNTVTDYDVGWTTPISRSGSPSQYDMTMWNSAFLIKNAPGFTYSAGSDLYIYNKSINANYGLTGSVYGVVTSPPSSVSLAAAGTATINGDLYPSSKLTVNGTGGTVTVNLRKGKTCTVYVNNTGAYTISTWNVSIDGGVTTTSIYWKNATVPSITSSGKDVFTFVNIDNNVFASAIQNFS